MIKLTKQEQKTEVDADFDLRFGGRNDAKKNEADRQTATSLTWQSISKGQDDKSYGGKVEVALASTA